MLNWKSEFRVSCFSLSKKYAIKASVAVIANVTEMKTLETERVYFLTNRMNWL